MGLTKETKPEGKNLLKITDGKIRKRIKDEEVDNYKHLENYEARIVENREEKTNETHHELVYKSIEGQIVSIATDKSKDSGREYLVIEMVDRDGEEFRVSMGLRTRYSTDLMTRLPMVDWGKWIKLYPFNFPNPNNPNNPKAKVIGVAIFQDDDYDKLCNDTQNKECHKVSPKWNQNNPMPADKVTPYSQDPEQWKLDYFRFLVNYTKANVLPKLDQVVPMSKKEENTVGQTTKTKDANVNHLVDQAEMNAAGFEEQTNHPGVQYDEDNDHLCDDDDLPF